MSMKSYVRKSFKIAAAVIIALALLFIYDQLQPVKLDYGNSNIYTERETAEVMTIIENRFSEEMDGCKLYSQCMVHYTDFRSPLFGNVVLNDYQRYHWNWYFGRTDHSNWNLLICGMA